MDNKDSTLSPRMTLEALYRKALKEVAHGRREEELREMLGDTRHLDCLFHPESHPVVWRLGDCDECPEEERRACAERCDAEALTVGPGGVEIDPEKCLACATCIDSCKMEALSASKDVIGVLRMLQDKGDRPVYALVAPAFEGQFPDNVTAGQLRTGFNLIGFDGMIEVALFADVLTLKEALEFDQNIQTEEDFQLTSCCCPMWIALIRRVYHQLMPHVPGSVSPMVAAGRAIKQLNPKALTVFIGPCLAKKAEAREKDLAGAIDYVLTFPETQDIFEAMEVTVSSLPETEKDHSSEAGRIYARVDGVSEAVRSTLAEISPDRKIGIRTRHADGVKDCRQMLNELVEGRGGANFYEGMGCIGGCVGGPKVIVPYAQGTENVNRYAAGATHKTPADNPYVMELLHRLGFDTIEQLVEESDIFTRKFS